MKRKITFTAPDGTKLTRTTAHDYTHAVLYFSPGLGAWRIGSCVGRRDLVAARLKYWRSAGFYCVAVPADQ